MTHGRFITLEGIEGAGKSTVARRGAMRCAARGIKVCAHARARRHAAGGAHARSWCWRAAGRAASPPATETAADVRGARGCMWSNLIRPALARGEWVMCDRFTDATRAYQGAGRGVDASCIEQLARRGAARICTPDLHAAAGPAGPKPGSARARHAPAPCRPIASRTRPWRSSSACATRYLELARAEPQRISRARRQRGRRLHVAAAGGSRCWNRLLNRP